MFKAFRFEVLYVALTPVLSLNSTGRTSGLACDSGDCVTSADPI